MKKTSQKIFPRVTALMLAVVSAFGFFTKAVKPPLPRGDYRIFNVAIIGSDVVADRAVEESPGFNKNIIENLCNVGTKLENFAEVGVLDENKISLAGRELPRTSMILPEQHIIFCFYDVANVYKNPEVIKECPYALCPYRLKLSEPYDAWTERSMRLRDFVKTRNEMCDLRYSTVVEGEFTEEIENYIRVISDIAVRTLDIYKYQQTVECRGGGPLGSDPAGYVRIIKNIIKWNREKLFEQCTGKSFPMITCCPGMAPIFFQEGEDRSIATPLIAPRVQPTRPAPAPITPAKPIAPTTTTPESETSEGSKKKSEQMPNCSGSNRRRGSSVDCDRLYMDCFVLLQPNGEPPLVYKDFVEKLDLLLKYNFRSNEIIDGFKKINFDGTRLEIEFAKFWGFQDRGKKYDSPKNAYKDIFSEKNKSVRKAFKKAFKKCIDEGAEPGQIVTALQNLQYYKDPEDYFDNYITVYSGVIETTRKEGGVGCNIQ